MRWVMEALMELPDHPVVATLTIVVGVAAMLVFVTI